MVATLHIDAPFDLDLTLNFDQGHRWLKHEAWYTEGGARYTSVLKGDYVEIHQAKKDGPLTVWPDESRIIKKLKWQFRLESAREEFGAIYNLSRQDPKMATLAKRYAGLRLMRVDPWECLVFFIMSAHNHAQVRVPTSPTARRMDEIAAEFWNAPRWSHQRYPFPTPADVASPCGLRKLQRVWSPKPWSRRTTSGRIDMPQRIHEAAHLVARGFLDDIRKNELNVHEVVELLTRLRGVGAKTAHSVALFGLGYTDAFPFGDQVANGIIHLYGRDPLGKYAGYASLYLFLEGVRNPSERIQQPGYLLEDKCGKPYSFPPEWQCPCEAATTKQEGEPPEVR